MKTILLVEDEQSMSDLIKQKLIKLGFNVLQAFDGKSAIEIYNDNKSSIDMILLDMGLPDIHGSNCITSFQQINKDVRIVICSGMKYEASKFGVLDELQKPFTFNELKDMCNQYI